MTDVIRIIAAVALIVGAGLVHGKWTNRWGVPPELAALAQRVDAVPLVIGDWKGEAFELPADERAMAGAVACLARRYTNPSRGISVTVLLVGGLPGKIVTHTPDACYPTAGYTLDSPAPFEYRPGPDQPPAGFRTALATRGGTSPSILRIFWSWHASKGWAAPEDARWRLASEPALCKLYIIRDTAGAVVEPASDPCTDFLRIFLPELDRCVFPAPR
jgi:Protein of unknown function (DUF3485)